MKRKRLCMIKSCSLVAIYDCLDHVKDQIIVEIYTGDGGLALWSPSTTVWITYAQKRISTGERKWQRLGTDESNCKDSPYLSEPLHHLYNEALFVMCALTILVSCMPSHDLYLDWEIVTWLRPPPPKHKNLSSPIVGNSVAIWIKYLTSYLHCSYW
jgi:hypothetical protein